MRFSLGATLDFLIGTEVGWWISAALVAWSGWSHSPRFNGALTVLVVVTAAWCAVHAGRTPGRGFAVLWGLLMVFLLWFWVGVKALYVFGS